MNSSSREELGSRLNSSVWGCQYLTREVRHKQKLNTTYLGPPRKSPFAFGGTTMRRESAHQAVMVTFESTSQRSMKN